MSIFRRRKNLGMLLLGIWLVATGLVHLISIPIPFSGQVLGLLAIVAGIFVLIDR